jgi:hypothetical protein
MDVEFCERSFALTDRIMWVFFPWFLFPCCNLLIYLCMLYHSWIPRMKPLDHGVWSFQLDHFCFGISEKVLYVHFLPVVNFWALPSY